MATAKEIRTLKGHSGMIESLAISSDGDTLVSGAWDSTVKSWNIKTGQLIRTFGKPIKQSDLSDLLPKNPPGGSLISDTSSVTTAAISPDGNTIISGNSNNIQLWDAKTGKIIRTIEGHSDWFQSVIISPDNKTLVSLNSNNTINIWDKNTGKRNRLIKDKWVSSIAISPDGKTIVTGSWDDKPIKLWDVQTGKLIRTFEDSGVNSVAVSPDGTILISASNEIIKLRDINTGKLLHKLEHLFPVSDIAISKNGNRLVSRNIGDEIILWDMQTGKLIRTLKKETVYDNDAIPVTSIAISPDGSTVVSGYLDGTIILQDASTGENIRTLNNQTPGVYSITISPDGNTLVSGSYYDNTIKFWNIRTGKLISTLEAHLYNVSSLAIGSDGKTLVSGSYDNTMKMWDMTNSKLLHTFCSLK
jgi:WD40 repeat protein